MMYQVTNAQIRFVSIDMCVEHCRPVSDDVPKMSLPNKHYFPRRADLSHNNNNNNTVLFLRLHFLAAATDKSVQLMTDMRHPKDQVSALPSHEKPARSRGPLLPVRPWRRH